MIPGIGKTLIFIGIVLIAVGAMLVVAQKVPWIGRLPGDICIKRENFTLYFPITTSILISIILSILFFIFGKR